MCTAHMGLKTGAHRHIHTHIKEPHHTLSTYIPACVCAPTHASIHTRVHTHIHTHVHPTRARARTQIAELRRRGENLPHDYLVVVVGDMVTEEALPSYMSMINRLDGGCSVSESASRRNGAI